MGELTAIGFRPGRSLLHRLDPRTKQALLMGLSVASLWGDGDFFGALHRRDHALPQGCRFAHSPADS